MVSFREHAKLKLFHYRLKVAPNANKGKLKVPRKQAGKPHGETVIDALKLETQVIFF